MHADFPVAALYVDPAGPYPALTREWYDEQRDARTYAGDLPVVTHPPCGPWGKLAWRCTKQDADAAWHALEVVRRNGGVLEHPVGSRLFREAGIPLPAPGELRSEKDAHGGYTIRVEQWDTGHEGAKATILYIVGTDDLPLQFRLARQSGEKRPVEHMAKSQRHLTPPAFAWALMVLASRCERPSRPTSGTQLSMFAA